MEDFKIDVTVPLAELSQRMETERRIILSARFGEGKSYLLHKLQENYKDRFVFFTLYSASYSNGPNEYYFEYIKRDIIYQLKYDYSKSLKRLDWQALLERLIKSTKLTFSGEQIGGLASFFGVDKRGRGVILKSSQQYIQSFNIPGSIYERDIYTEFITSAFNEIREENNKKIVLVIEDLDRLEPSQMFNIINVFGSQIDRKYIQSGNTQDLDNKFGADIIISVMDIERAEKSYEHLFGEQSNFNGFIAKYLDSTPYRYSINSLARNLVADILFGLYCFPCQDSVLSELSRAKNNLGRFLEKYSVREMETFFNFLKRLSRATSDYDAILLSRKYQIPKNYPYVIIEAFNKVFGIDLIGLQMDDTETKDFVHDLILVQYYAIQKLVKQQSDDDVTTMGYVTLNKKTYRFTYTFSNNKLQSILLERIVDFADTEDLYDRDVKSRMMIISETRKLLADNCGY